jgi:HD-like signal output (HDOD) protein
MSNSSVNATLLGKPVRAARLSPALLTSYLGEMPVSPAVLPRLQTLLASDSFETGEVLELVRLDPGLAARLIHAAGSAACARGEPVRSLDEALFRLGSHEAYRLTATVAMSQFLNTPLQVYGVDPRTFWRQSIACALAMVDLAPAAQLDDRVAYTIGLLHAMGMVFIDHHLRVASGPLTQVHGHPTLDRQEFELTGMSQAEVAAFILRSWNVSEEVVEPIEHQFNPGRAPHHRAMTLLLGEARTLAGDIIAALPQPGSTVPSTPSTNQWVDDIVAQIRQIESW